MDNLIFEESIASEIDQSEFVSKKWVYVNDSNAGNYSSQVVIDSTPLSNAGSWLSLSEGFIILNLVVQFTSAAAGSIPAGGKNTDFAWAFKAGFHHMINSSTIEFNNSNVCQQTPFSNVFKSFKLMTSYSEADVTNHSGETGFIPDTASSWAYQPTSTGPTDSQNSNGMETFAGGSAAAASLVANP